MTSATVGEEFREKSNTKHTCVSFCYRCDPRKHYKKPLGQVKKKKKTIQLNIKMKCLEENQQISPTKERLEHYFFQMIPYIYNLKW